MNALNSSLAPGEGAIEYSNHRFDRTVERNFKTCLSRCLPVTRTRDAPQARLGAGSATAPVALRGVFRLTCLVAQWGEAG